MGTMFLIMTIRLSGVLSEFAPFAIGTLLMVLVYQFGWISGGHYNPAVSIAILIRGNFDCTRFTMYIISQFIGAIVGGIFGNIIGGEAVCTAGPYVDETSYSLAQGYAGELFFTFLLTYVVLHTGTHQDGNQFYGLSIGFSLFVAINCIGSITGCAINPAVWLGLNIAGIICDTDDTVKLDQIWLYWCSEIIAGCVSGFLFRFVYLPAHEQLENIKEMNKNMKNDHDF